MKTANFLSLTAFIALAGLFTSVGCSTPVITELEDDSSALSDEEDEDDGKTSKKKTSKTTEEDEDLTETEDEVTDGTGVDGDDGAAGGDECTTCLSKNAKAVKFDQCAISCQDQACADNCMQTSGCGADASCQSTLESCDATCFPGGGEDPGVDPGAGDDPCLQCLGSSPAAGYIQCVNQQQCQDMSCDDQCFDQACGGNEQACDSKLGQCEQQCFGGF